MPESGDYLDLICTECQHTWRSSFQLPMEVSAFAKACKAVVCPKCQAGFKKLNIKT